MLNKKLILIFVILMATLANAAPPSNGVTFLKSNSKEIEMIRIDSNKTIKRYPSTSRIIEMNVMKVNGRSPMNSDHYIYNSLVHFMIYVTKGKGVFYVDNKAFETSEGDVLDVPPKTRFAVSGQGLEYITIENPAFFAEQSYIVDSKGNVVEKGK